MVLDPTNILSRRLRLELGAHPHDQSAWITEFPGSPISPAPAASNPISGHVVDNIDDILTIIGSPADAAIASSAGIIRGNEANENWSHTQSVVQI